MKYSYRRRSRGRMGAATVEFAVCIPIIVLIVLGSIEAANMLFLRQALIQGAYEGAKVAVLRDSTNSEAVDAVNAVTAGRRLNGIEIEFDPPNIETAEPGDFIEVIVSAPGGSNSFLRVSPFSETRVSAKAVMVRE